MELEAATGAVRGEPTAIRFAVPPRSADPVGLARSQQRDELAAGAVEPDAGDAALLEVDAPAGQVVDDLAEVGLVADGEHALVRAGGPHEVERGRAVEALREGLLVDRLDPERLARELGRLAGADLRAREAEMHLDFERLERTTGLAR